MADPVTLAIIGGTALKAGGQIAEGNAAEQAAKFEASQMERNATATQAEASRAAYERGREGRILESDAIAAMAAGGGTSTDAGAVEIRSKILRDADYNVLSTIYEGGRRAEGQRMQAAGRRVEGKQAKRSSRLRALSTVISGGTSAYQSYQAGQTP